MSVRFTPMRAWPSVAREPLRLRPGVPLGIDFEWNVQTGEPTILGVSDGEATFSIPWSSSADALLRQLLVPEPVLVGHNFIPADRPFLPRPPYPLSKIKDTILLHWLANMHLCKAAVKEHDTAEGHGYMNLWSMMSLYSSFPYWKSCIQCDPLGPEVPCPKHSPYWYNGLDALGPLLVLPGLEADCRRKNVLGLYDLHARTAEVLDAINRIGVAVDVEYVRKVRKRWQERTDVLGAELPFNPNSPKQVIAYFKERGVALSDCQRPTIIAAAEEHPRNRVLQRLSEYKMLGDGIDRWFAPQALDETTGYYTGYVTPQGRVHPWLGFYTSSSRLMCSGPNLQNVPKRGVDPITGEKFGDVVRRAIIADDECYLLKADFQNAEGNVVLALANEKRPSGDFHEATAKRMGLKASDPLAKAFGSVREAAKSITHACLTGDHEVLTVNGWLPIEQWDGQQIAQFEPSSGRIEFIQPTAFHYYKADELIETQGRGFDQLSTLNHRFPLLSSGTWRGRKYNTWRRVEAQALPLSGRIPVAGELADSSTEVFSDQEIRQTVAVQADGSLYGRNRVRFHFTKRRKIDRIRLLFPEIELKPCSDHAARGVQGCVSFKSGLLDAKKSFTSGLLLLSSRQRKIFLDELLLWDGHRPKNTSGVQTCYVNTDYQSASWVHTVLHLSGHGSLLRKRLEQGKKILYTVSYNRRRFASVECLKQRRQEGSFEVFCFTVPSSSFLVRYRDTISMTGNSNYLEGLQLVGQGSLNKPTLMREVACGARLVFDNWKVGGRVVTFTGINLAKRAFGDASYVNRKRALDFLVSYYKAYPGVQKVQRRVLTEAIEGHGVRHPDGFWTALMGDLGDQAKTAMAITGSSPVATLTKRAMLNAHEDGRMRVSLQVHDELLFNVPRSMSRVKALAHVRSYMEIESNGVPGLVLPIDAKAGPNWAQVKEIK